MTKLKEWQNNIESQVAQQEFTISRLFTVMRDKQNELEEQLNKFKSLVKPAHKNTLLQIDTVRNSVQHIFRLDGELYIGALIKEGNDIYYVDDLNNRCFIDRDTPCIYTEELHLLFGEE